MLPAGCTVTCTVGLATTYCKTRIQQRRMTSRLHNPATGLTEWEHTKPASCTQVQNVHVFPTIQVYYLSFQRFSA